METASDGENASGKRHREPLSKVSLGGGTLLGCRCGTAGSAGESQREIGQGVWYRVSAQPVPLEFTECNS